MNKAELAGIGFGLGAAVFQSLSYLCSRLFIKRHNDNILTLLALSHIVMGVISVPLAAILWPASMPELSEYVWSLLCASGFYLLGQFFLFAAIIHSEPSRISPLLGLKVFMLSIIGVVFLNQRFGLSQWLAVACSTAAVFLLSWSGKGLQRRFIILGILASLSYCLSDLGVKATVEHFSFMPTTLHAASMATALCYILCGLVGAGMVLLKPAHSTRQTWLYALPFAASWFIAMILLFTTFGLIGVVFGNILQSSRGIISIGMGFMVAHVGFETLEPKASRQMVVQRLAAAILMTGAVALFLM